jgi:hypothetical protein
MNSNASIKPALVERPSTPTSAARSSGHLAGSDRPTFGELVAESVSWIGFVFVAGPPLIFLAVPWLVLVLSLIWPFAFLFMLAAAFIAVIAAVGFAGAVLATPYLLIRRVRARRTVRAHVSDSTAHLLAVESSRAIA